MENNNIQRDADASPDTKPVAASTKPRTKTGTGRRLRKGASNTATPPSLNQLRYPCLMNMDYHAAREAWLDRLHRWLMFTVIIAGASAIVEAWDGLRIWGPAVAVLAGALDLTFDLANRARAHAMFRRRYAEILAEATRSPDQLAKLQCKLDEIYGEEEPAFAAQLALSAIKAQQATYGGVTDSCRPNIFYRTFGNVFRFSGHDFNEAEDAVTLPAASSPPNCD